VVWVDESYRLHAAKVFSVMRLLKPRVIYCFGDSKQIPVLPFVPEMDFRFHRVPFTREEFKKDTYRSPADVCLGTSQLQYYGVHVVTHSTVRRSLQPVRQFTSSDMFKSRPSGVVLLVYTQSVKDGLAKDGVEGVSTIGEFQGDEADHIVLFRDSELNKALYYDLEQTLVAVTRHRVSFSYVTVCLGSDDSAVAEFLKYVFSKQSDLLLSSHYSPAGGSAVDTRPQVEEVFGEEDSGSEAVDWSSYSDIAVDA